MIYLLTKGNKSYSVLHLFPESEGSSDLGLLLSTNVFRRTHEKD